MQPGIQYSLSTQLNEEQFVQEHSPPVHQIEPSLTGTTLAGQYELLESLGNGAVGTVYRARDLKMGIDVAVKVLRDVIRNNASAMKRLANEAKALANLQHIHIVKVLALKIEDKQAFLVMEYLKGRNLQEVLAAEGPLTAERARRLFRPVADALQHAHDKGIIHRDLKPSNLQLVNEGTEHEMLKILDFGIAKMLDESNVQNTTSSGTCLGTAHYMSPEQTDGRRVDCRADIYSLGCVLYESVTGKKPFTGDSAMEILYKHGHEPFPALGINGAADLEQVIETATAKLPADRYQSMLELSDSLAPGHTAISFPLRHRPMPNGRRKNYLKIVAMGALGAITACGITSFVTCKNNELQTHPESLAYIRSLHQLRQITHRPFSISESELNTLCRNAENLGDTPTQKVLLLTLIGQIAYQRADFHGAKCKWIRAIHEAQSTTTVSAATAATCLATQYMSDEEPADATKVLETELARGVLKDDDPLLIQMRSALCQNLCAQQRYAEALKIIDTLPAHSRENQLIRSRVQCAILASEKKYPEAIDKARQWSNRHRHEACPSVKYEIAEGHRMCGTYLLQMNRMDEAEREFADCAAATPDPLAVEDQTLHQRYLKEFILAYTGLAQVALSRQHCAEAIDYARKAIKINPQSKYSQTATNIIEQLTKNIPD